eukprot:3347089-Pyramimonas_sp.AAC.1
MSISARLLGYPAQRHNGRTANLFFQHYLPPPQRGSSQARGGAGAGGLLLISHGPQSLRRASRLTGKAPQRHRLPLGPLAPRRRPQAIGHPGQTRRRS